jgi:hypothetical protein
MAVGVGYKAKRIRKMKNDFAALRCEVIPSSANHGRFIWQLVGVLAM